MARRVREWDPKFRRPTSGAAANQAISDWTAQHSYQLKGKQLTKQVKKAERKMTLAGESAQAHSKAAARYGESLQGANAALQAQATKNAALLRRLEQQQKALSKSIATDPKYIAKGNPSQPNKVTAEQKEYYERQMKKLPEYKAYQRAVAQYNTGAKQYQAQTSHYETLSDRIARANKRTQRLNRQYLAAYRRLKRHRYVPYTPA